MRARAIALPSALKLYRPESPTKTQTPLFGLNIIENDSVDEPPYKGWQVINKPVPISFNDENRGVYLVEINDFYQDFSVFNDRDKLNTFFNELYFLMHKEKVNHIILSFYNCCNLHDLKDQPVGFSVTNKPVKGPDSFAEALVNLKISTGSCGKKLSVVHVEPTLYENEKVQDFNSFLHSSVPDAVRNGHTNNFFNII